VSETTEQGLSKATLFVIGEVAADLSAASGVSFREATESLHAVAALVAAAEERGFDRGVRAAGSSPALAAVRAEAEWRGAEKERERTAAAMDSLVGHSDDAREKAPYWYSQLRKALS
jgi:hypothetical protein